MVEFGSVNYLTFKSLQDVGTVVQHSQGVSQSTQYLFPGPKSLPEEP